MAATQVSVDVRLARARVLVAAIETSDADAEVAALQEILEGQESELYESLSRIAFGLKKSLGSVRVEGKLSRMAQSDLPDAQLRLAQVLDLTEQAAHTSLSAVEKALPIMQGVARSTREFPMDSDSPSAESVGQLLATIESESAVVEACLSEVLMAQGFQDLTGQIIRRVAELVAELEQLLSHSPLGESAIPEKERAEALRRGTGPAVAGRDGDDRVSGQSDVDDLLGQLGL